MEQASPLPQRARGRKAQMPFLCAATAYHFNDRVHRSQGVKLKIRGSRKDWQRCCHTASEASVELSRSHGITQLGQMQNSDCTGLSSSAGPRHTEKGNERGLFHLGSPTGVKYHGPGFSQSSSWNSLEQITLD